MNVPVKPIDSWSRGLRLPRKQRQHESSSKANRQLVKRNLRLPRKQRQHESSSKANRQLVKRNPPLPRKQRQHESSTGQEESAVVFWWNRPPTHETKQVCTGIEEDYLGNSVSMNLPDVRHMTDESLAPFHRNRGRLPRKPRQHESSSKASTGSPESKEIASETASA
ncbi:unnamed protein product [Protopolystoma xenopodis]|uniref:Uncharacterized protein n=1 Tax=Protopolystoma xenopodis TaxID=117903 RepID=A0A3S5A6C9_9PLAT|nr:unnamed protein product [Protopolystoma xenopodis]